MKCWCDRSCCFDFFFCYFSALFLFFLLRWPFIRAMSHHILSHHLLRCNLAYCGLTAFTVLHTIPTGLCVHHFYVIISIRRLSKLHVEPIWRWFRVHYRTRCPNRIVLPGEAMCKCAVNALLSTARQQSNKRDDDVGFQFSLYGYSGFVVISAFLSIAPCLLSFGLVWFALFHFILLFSSLFTFYTYFMLFYVVLMLMRVFASWCAWPVAALKNVHVTQPQSMFRFMFFFFSFSLSYFLYFQLERIQNIYMHYSKA